MDNIEIKLIYRKLKQAIYYDPSLFLRYKMAEYESTAIENNRIDNILKSLLNNEGTSEEDEKQIDGWIEEIKFNQLPKKIETQSDGETKNADNKIKAISNVYSSPEYFWEKSNYHIDIPIPLLMLDILWIMKVGSLLEEEIGDCCYANRMHKSLQKEIENKDPEKSSSTSHVFKKFGEQYSTWRDTALKIAEKSVENNEIVTIINLDFTSFFYCINIDFEIIEQKIIQKYGEEEVTSLFLNKILEKIHKKYTALTKEHLLITHKEIPPENLNEGNILPIGLFSSGILANWHLIDFDKEIIKKINPRYYGRYVDDCIFVISQPKYLENEIEMEPKTADIIDKYFCQTGILKIKNESDPIKYSINIEGCSSEITIQNEKIKTITVDPSHSRTILKMLKNHFE